MLVQPQAGAGAGPSIEPFRQRLKLGLKLAILLSLVLIVAAAILFIPAGTLKFWQGWALLAAYFIPVSLANIYFLISDPRVIERRMEQKESVREQKLLMRWGKLYFAAVFLIPGFDDRWGWTRHLFGGTPRWLSPISLTLISAAFLFVFWVIKVNRFAARTIRVEEGQEVISTGPYGWVRHPMYFGGVVLWMFTPLALGSYVALPAFALLIPLFVFRLLHEEKVLRRELKGYTEYCGRTRYHLVPFVW